MSIIDVTNRNSKFLGSCMISCTSRRLWIKVLHKDLKINVGTFVSMDNQSVIKIAKKEIKRLKHVDVKL